jgi:hypothetical protein
MLKQISKMLKNMSLMFYFNCLSGLDYTVFLKQMNFIVVIEKYTFKVINRGGGAEWLA